LKRLLIETPRSRPRRFHRYFGFWSYLWGFETFQHSTLYAI